MKKIILVMSVVITVIIAITAIIKYDRLKIDLNDLIDDSYDSVESDFIKTDNNELNIHVYIKDDKTIINDSFEIRNTVKEYLLEHEEYKDMRVVIQFHSYSQSFSITFSNYDDYRTNISFKNSYDLNFGWFNCDFTVSLTDLKNIKGLQDLEILGFNELADFSDPSVLDQANHLKYLFVRKNLDQTSEIDALRDHMAKKHPDCKVVVEG